MCVPPHTDDPTTERPSFRRMKGMRQMPTLPNPPWLSHCLVVHVVCALWASAVVICALSVDVCMQRFVPAPQGQYVATAPPSGSPS